MNGLGFYALSNAWLFALIIPLVVFYFLKLKRPRLIVPSLALWRQVMTDRRVNSPFQRFKKNLLLLLQLLLLMLLVLGAMQPFRRARAARVQRIPILIDCSASMGALDRRGGITRLEEAKRKVGEIIDGLLPDQEVCLVSFGSAARRRCDFTGDKRALRRALAEIRVEDVGGRIDDALRMTEALARGAPFDEVLLLSDGNFAERAHFDLSFALDYQQLRPAGPNVGITSLTARRSAHGGWDVFTLVEGSSGWRGPTMVEFVQGGRVMATQSVAPEQGAPERMVVGVSSEEDTSLEVRLTPGGFDSLAGDNVAYLELPAVRLLQVYLPPEMKAFEHALKTFEDVTLHSGSDRAAREAVYDLVVSDRPEDLAIRGRTRCYAGVVPGELQELVEVTEEGSSVVDWRRSSPLLQYVEFGDVLILEQPRSREDASEADYERLGYEVLVHGETGPLVLRRRQGEQLTFLFLFRPTRSTLPYRVGFPVIVSNLIQIALDRAGLAEALPRTTGVLGEVSVEPNTTYLVRGPDGGTREQRAGADGILSGIPAPRVGRYEVSADGTVHSAVGASLLDARETTLARAGAIQFDEDLSVSAAAQEFRTDRTLWPLLAVGAFCVLLCEWWFYQRGPGGRTWFGS